jgi:hypothetical protein
MSLRFGFRGYSSLFANVLMAFIVIRRHLGRH